MRAAEEEGINEGEEDGEDGEEVVDEKVEWQQHSQPNQQQQQQQEQEQEQEEEQQQQQQEQPSGQLQQGMGAPLGAGAVGDAGNAVDNNDTNMRQLMAVDDMWSLTGEQRAGMLRQWLREMKEDAMLVLRDSAKSYKE